MFSVCFSTGERKRFFCVSAKHFAALPGSIYKTFDEAKRLVERECHILEVRVLMVRVRG